MCEGFIGKLAFYSHMKSAMQLIVYCICMLNCSSQAFDWGIGGEILRVDDSN